jgi:hypothetical protein
MARDLLGSKRASTSPGTLKPSASQTDSLQNVEERRIKPTMTCRIERRIIGENLVILHISGRITEQDVDTLRASLDRECGVVAVDLEDVFIVNWEAIKLLAMRELNGVELRNCPGYVREWVTRERADRTKDGNEHGEREEHRCLIERPAEP